MAEERIPPIEIPIIYKEEGYKKVISHVEEFGSSKGVRQTISLFSELSETFESTRDNFTITKKTIADLVDQTANSFSQFAKQVKEYERLRDEAASYKRNMAKDPKRYTQKGLDKIIARKEIAWEGIESSKSELTANYQSLLREQNKINVAQAESSAKAQAKAEREAAKAVQQAAKEQVAAKKRVDKAYKDLGKTFKKLPQSFSKGIRTFAATLYVLRRITNSIKQAFKQISDLIDASSSWVENLNLLEVVFGDVSKGAQKTKDWVSDLARTFSMDKNAIAQNVAMFKQMANAMGQAADVGERMSEVLVQLGLDISSLRNVKTETAMNDGYRWTNQASP